MDQLSNKELEIFKWIDEFSKETELISYQRANMNIMMANFFFIVRSYLEKKSVTNE